MRVRQRAGEGIATGGVVLGAKKGEARRWGILRRGSSSRRLLGGWYQPRRQNDISSGVVERIPPKLNPCRLYCCWSTGPGGYTYYDNGNNNIINIILHSTCAYVYIDKSLYTHPVVFCLSSSSSKFRFHLSIPPTPLHRLGPFRGPD